MSKISKRVLPMAMAAVMISQTGVFAASEYFKDVTTKYQWAQEAIDYLKDSGVVAGFNDGYFRPGDTIKRCDFLIMLFKQFGDDNAHYAVLPEDVEAGVYYEGAYRWAADTKVVEGGSFRPTEPITREEAFGYLYSCLCTSGALTEKDKGEDLSKFSDGIDVDADKREAVATLARAGIVNGTNGAILPKHTITRAEMAVIFYQAAEKEEEVEKASSAIQEDTKTNVTVVTADSKFEINTSAETKYLLEGDKGELDGINEDIKEDGKSAAIVQNGGNLTIKNSNINKSGKSLSSVNTGTSGVNSAIIVRNGATLELLNTVINTSGDYSNGISILGNNNTVNLNGAQMVMSGDNSTGILLNDNSKLNVKNSQVTIKKNSGDAAISIKSESSTADISGSTVSAYGENASAIRAEGSVNISSSTLNSEKSVALEILGTGNINLDDVEFNSAAEALIKITVNPKEASKHGILNKTNITNTSIKPNKNIAGVEVINTSAEVYITNCDIEAEDVLFNCRYDRGVNANASDASAVITLDNQYAKGNVVSGSNAPLSLILKNGSKLVGQLNGNQDGIVDINLESDDDKLDLTGDCYVRGFENHMDYGFSNIKDNGRNIYYDKDDDANMWLDGEEYSLPNGGTLMPK